jgi:uncharacterized protein YqeY
MNNENIKILIENIERLNTAMIDVQKKMIAAMKKELFINNDNLNKAARQVLGEMKTKFKDIKEEITAEIQYKMLQKMKKDRENSIKIYTEAYEKTNSDVAKMNLEKAQNELEPIDLFLLDLESEMPKKFNEEQTKELIENLLKRFDEKPNMGMIMKLLKANVNIDMAVASKIVKTYF